MQTAGDDRPLSPLVVERTQPGAALGLGDYAGLDGRLGAAVGHARIETLQMGLEREEAARADVYEAGSLEEQRQLADEPAVDRCRIRSCSNNATGEAAIGMRERGHIRVEVEDAETSPRAQDANQFGDGSFPLRNVRQDGHTHGDVK